MHRRNLSPAAPAGGLPTSANTSGAPVDAGALRFAHPVRLFPGLVFKGNGECSPHSTYDYLSARVALVPTLEREAPMLRAYKQAPDADSPSSVTYFDLPTGTIVQATLAQNWTEQAMTYTYASLRPNTVDAAPYAAALAGLAAVARGLASGRGAPASGGGGAPSCNAPLPMLNDTADYLEYVQAQLPNATAGTDGLRPTEARAPSGCIVELNTYYKGDAVGDMALNVRTYDACCQLCRSRQGCNVFVWCPLTSGCAAVGGGNATAPFLSCQLQRQAGLGGQPGALPAAWQRGPPASFVSVEALLRTGRALLTQHAPGAPQKFGFHYPPFNSVNHLHLHCFGLPHKWWGRGAYLESEPPQLGFVTAEQLLRCLRAAPPAGAGAPASGVEPAGR